MRINTRIFRTGTRFRAPKGLYDSAWGFNPRNLPPRRRALKGRRRTRSIPPDLAPPNRVESPVDVHAETGGEYTVFSPLLGQSMWRPFRARWGLGPIPGRLKPRAESCSPFGAKTPRLFQLPSLPRGQREQFRNTLQLADRMARIASSLNFSSSGRIECKWGLR